VSVAQEAKQLRDENTRLRKLVADLSRTKEALPSEKTAGGRSLEGGGGGQVRDEYAFSERRVGAPMTRAVSSYRCQTRRTDEPLRMRRGALARQKRRSRASGTAAACATEPRGRNGGAQARVHLVYRELASARPFRGNRFPVGRTRTSENPE